MSGTIEKKTISHCDCPSSKNNRDVIVITIETCCKRNCDGGSGAKPPSEEELPPRTPSSHHVSPTEPSRVNFTEGDGDSQDSHYPSEHSALDDAHSVRDPSAYSVRDPSAHTVAEPSAHSVRDPSAISVARSESRVSRTVSTNAPGSVRSEHSLIIEEKPVFKLPVLIERHHGPGCAMEISVLEKHDDSCVYRKGPGEGRNIDDRVGSYECIGRMVFRTCNANELESDSSGSQGIKPGRASPSSTSVTKKPSDTRPSPSRSIPPSASASQPAAQPSMMSSTSKRQQSAVSSPSFHGTTKSQHSTYSSAKSQMVVEEPASKETHEPVESARRRRHNRHDPQIMMATTTRTVPQGIDFGPMMAKKHFNGDSCKLHGPKTPILLPNNPLLLPSGQFDKIYSSKKTFPTFPKVSDESNQTDSRAEDDESRTSKFSLETISSLTDLSKQASKRKSSFLGSLFKKGPVKIATAPEVKKLKK